MAVDELTAQLNRENIALKAENERLRATLSEIEDFARGEGDVGNIVARKAAAALRPDTAVTV
jgi:regulator of replication initiation timing